MDFNDNQQELKKFSMNSTMEVPYLKFSIGGSSNTYTFGPQIFLESRIVNWTISQWELLFYQYNSAGHDLCS